MDTQDAIQPPPPRTITLLAVWTLRLLALAGLGVALFLVGVHVLAYIQATRVTGPYCNLLGFFDCDTVLNSEWATWFGVPVPVLGSAAYAALLGGLFMPLRTLSAERSGRVWAWLCAVSITIAGAAGWFIFLQTVRLDRTYCMWCMVEHAIGIALFLLIWMHAFANGSLTGGRAAAAGAVGMVCVGLLIGGQHLDTHEYLGETRVAVGTVDDRGRYSEVDEASRDRALIMMGGMVELDPAKHPMIGGRAARRIVLEAIDYTCPRCKRLSELLRQARPLLGVDYAVMVITTPLHPHCNSYYAQDFGGEIDPKHRYACELAELAQAVWLANPARFPAFHDWLFEHQDELREVPDRARQQAVELVGESELTSAMDQGRAAELVHRDVELSVKLGVGALPGLFANNRVFNAVPEQPDTLAQQLQLAFEAGPTE